MQSMKQQTAIIGRSLRNAASRNFKEAARRENVSRRGNLSLSCPNHFRISMNRTNCYSCSQTALKEKYGVECVSALYPFDAPVIVLLHSCL